MGVFAIGTAPGLLGIGGLTAAVKGAFARHFFRFAGIVVTLLALFNISNGWNLASPSINLPSLGNTAAAQVNDPNVTIENGVQIVKMTQSASGYAPNAFTIQKGIPVKWVIDAQEANSCSSVLVAPSINVKKGLAQGENTITFTPTETGTIKFSCIMGMYSGAFTVVEAKNPAVKADTNKNTNGSTAQGNADAPTPTTAQPQNDAQVITATYSLANDIQPNKFTLKAGKPVRFEINPEDDGQGCMGSIMIPGLTNTPEIIEKNKKIVLSFTPNAGHYQITCAMGIPRGEITVE
jgi:plastocyanin domain-containing protein